MWLILGLIAIVATFINLYMYKIGKDYKLAMAMGLWGLTIISILLNIAPIFLELKNKE